MSSRKQKMPVKEVTGDLYKQIIDETMAKVKSIFQESGVDESVWLELRNLWDEYIQESGVVAEKSEGLPFQPNLLGISAIPGGFPIKIEPHAALQSVLHPRPGMPQTTQIKPPNVLQAQAPTQQQHTIQLQQQLMAQVLLQRQQEQHRMLLEQQRLFLLQQQQHASNNAASGPTMTMPPPEQQQQYVTYAPPTTVQPMYVTDPVSGQPMIMYMPCPAVTPSLADVQAAAAAAPPPPAAVVQYQQQVGAKRPLEYADESLPPSKQVYPNNTIPQIDGPADDATNDMKDENKNNIDDNQGTDDDEDALNAADDLNDEDDLEEINEDDIPHVIVGQYEKVQRSKAKWKIVMKGCVGTVNGKDILLKKFTGEATF